MKIEIERVNNKVHLEAKNEQGIIVHMDGSPEIGGEDLGARPMQLILMGLGGCTSMDMLSVLKKMREDVKSYKVTVDAERATEHPMVFTKI
ncbi:MAG TPA: OsmC family protein, partial [Chitinophagales bacterium]|nr:OsmC family protein [Chitinophagales bacterium]